MAQSIRKPLKEGVAKVPVIIQMEALECGAASLAMILAYYGKWIPLTQVRQDCGVSRDGSSLKKMYLAAKNYGMEVKGFRMEPDALKKQATFPCIIHWDFKHFVVLNGFKKNKAVINDPARGTVHVPMEEFDRSFTGPCLIMEPGEQFQPSGKRRSVADYAKKSLKGASATIVFVVLTTIISYLFGAINPVMSRIFFDRLLNGEAPSWVQPFMLVMAILCVLQITVEWIRTVYSIKINGKLEIEGNTSYVWKVLHLPMEFFSQRMAGDLLNRQTANATIANTLVNTVGPLVLDTIMMLFYLVIMLRYNVFMTLIGVGSMLLNIFAARFVSKKRVNLTWIQMRDSGRGWISPTEVRKVRQAGTPANRQTDHSI